MTAPHSNLCYRAAATHFPDGIPQSLILEVALTCLKVRAPALSYSLQIKHAIKRISGVHSSMPGQRDHESPTTTAGRRNQEVGRPLRNVLLPGRDQPRPGRAGACMPRILTSSDFMEKILTFSDFPHVRMVFADAPPPRTCHAEPPRCC